MSAKALFEAGYKDLVSVIPPGAQLTSNSEIREVELGKVPGQKGKSGGWYGYNFLGHSYPDSPDRAAVLDKWGANVGLHAAHFPALDIDSDSPALTRLALRIAEEHFGPAPVRLSRGSRRLLVYRTEEPFTRMALIITPPSGKGHLVEFLGQGRQYLVHGTHPKGEKYRWEDPPLWEWPALKLRLITAEQAEAYLSAMAGALREKGIGAEMVGSPKSAAELWRPQDSLKAPSEDALVELLSTFRNPEGWGWERYIELGYAVKAAGQDFEDSARASWLDWASRWEGGENDAGLDERNWESLHPPYRVGWERVLEITSELSEVYDSTADLDFEVSSETPPAPPEGIEIPKGKGKHVHLTEEWVANAILPRVRGRLRYAVANKGWYVWMGHHWAEDEGMDHEVMVRDELLALAVQLQTVADEAPGRQGARYAKLAERLQSAAGVSAILRLLQALLAVNPGDFDPDPWSLATPAGRVDLKTGEVHPSMPDDMALRHTTVAPAPGPTPLWDRFLGDLSGGDEDLSRYLEKTVGYCLNGSVEEKSLWFIWGSSTDTGKSTFIRTVSKLLGTYSYQIDVEALLAKRSSSIPADIAELPGVRLVTAAEPSAGAVWDESRVKGLTGGDEIPARHLYGRWFTFRPQFTVLIVGNSEPELRHVDSAMMRRIHIVPMNRRIPKAQQIADLSDRIYSEEGSAVLHKLIQAGLAWRKEGLPMPAEVAAATMDYAEDEDLTEQWAEQELEEGDGYECTRHELYQSWTSWCRSRREDPGGFKAFRRLMYPVLASRGAIQTRVGSQRGYSRIRLRAPEDFNLEGT